MKIIRPVYAAIAAVMLTACAGESTESITEEVSASDNVASETEVMTVLSDTSASSAETSETTVSTTTAKETTVSEETEEETTAETTTETTCETTAATTTATSAVTTAATPTEAKTEATATAETTVTPETTSETAPETEPITEEQSDMLLFYTFDNEAWGFYQEIIVFGADGNMYTYKTPGDYEDEEGVEWRYEQWYANLKENVMTDSGKWCGNSTMDMLGELNVRLPEYENAELHRTELGYSDYGFQNIYGVYADENGTAHKVHLACYGEAGAGIIDDPYIIGIVNSLLESKYFSFDGCLFDENGEPTEN